MNDFIKQSLIINGSMKKILLICFIYPSELTSTFGDFLFSLTTKLNKQNINHVLAFPYERINSELAESNIKKLENLGVKIKIISERNKTLEFIKLVKEIKPCLIHIHYCYPPYLPFNLYCYLKKIPLIYTEHFLPIKKNNFKGFIRNVLHKFEGRIFNLGISRIICVSNYVKNEHINHYSVSNKKIFTIYNGVNIKRFNICKNDQIREEFNIAENSLVITFIGVIREGKGLDRLIKVSPQILNKIQNIIFLIVGEGPDLLRIKEMVKELGVGDFFVFVGWRDDVERLLSISQVLVIPSVIPEAFCYVAAEGMVAGVPVVASDTAGLREVVENGKTGFLVEQADQEELADKIIKILTNKVVAKNFSKNGINRVKKLYSIERTVSEHIEVYSKLL